MIKIAQIGIGHDHAVCMINSLKNLPEIFEIVGYCIVPEEYETAKDKFDEKTRKSYDDIKEMTVEEILNFEGLQAVTIETEDRSLTKYAILAAEKGLAIQMDKPGSASDEDFDKLIDLVKENNLVFSTGYMYRFNPAVIELKEKIKKGDFGEIYSIDATMNCTHNVLKREWLKNYPSGMLYFLGCHLIDLVYSILGEPKNVIPLSRHTGIDNVDADDFGMAIFEYENGVSTVKSTSVECGGYLQRRLTLCGSKGTFEIQPLESHAEENLPFAYGLTTSTKENHDNNWGSSPIIKDYKPFPRYNNMLCAFADYILGKKENPYSYEYERNLHKLILKACTKKTTNI